MNVSKKIPFTELSILLFFPINPQVASATADMCPDYVCEGLTGANFEGRMITCMSGFDTGCGGCHAAFRPAATLMRFTPPPASIIHFGLDKKNNDQICLKHETKSTFCMP